MEHARIVRLSKLLSFGLRHQPQTLGLVLDGAGWVLVERVLEALAARGEVVTRAELEDIVRSSDKQRFALSEDRARIRANQGHSIEVDLGLVARDPPALLYHGTVDRFVESIRQSGLVRGTRAYVHLSGDEKTARVVARRRRGAVVILVVRAGEMRRDGLPTYLSENGVWLADHVPPAYIDYPSAP